MIRTGLFFALILAGASAKYLAAPPAATNFRQGLNILFYINCKQSDFDRELSCGHYTLMEQPENHWTHSVKPPFSI